MKIKKILIFLLFPVLLFLLGGCTNKPTPNPDSKPNPLTEYSVKFYSGADLLFEAKIKHNTKITKLPENPTKTGHTFEGWYRNNSFTEKFDASQKITSDINIYAKFKPIIYTVTFYDNSDVLLTKQVEYNNIVELPKGPEKENYNFLGWYSDSSLTNSYNPSAKITGDTDIYARYLNDLDYFLFARANTIDNDTFKYTYKLDFTNVLENNVKNIPLPGAFYNGTTYYNKNNIISYLRDELTSGALIKDHHNYNFLKDGNLHKVVYKHNKKKNKDTDPREKIENNYKNAYEYSIYAKALFKYEKDKFASVSRNGSIYELKFNESQIDLIKEFLISHGQNAIAEKLKQENIRTIKVSAIINRQTHQISKFKYSFEFEQEMEKVVLGKTVKGTLVSKLEYELTFDNTFNGTIPLDEKVKPYI